MDAVRDKESSPGERSDPKIDDIDVEALLSHTRPLTVRKRSLYHAPEFIKRLNALEEAKAGDTVVFTCRYKGFPKPAVKWYRDNEDITDSDALTFEEKEGELKLIIENAKTSDEATYRCSAENKEGVTSTTGYLSVTVPKDKPLSSQTRNLHTDRAVSSAPYLRSITEWASQEAREEDDLTQQGPSPLQGYIDSLRRGRPHALIPEEESGPGQAAGQEGDDASSGSDTSVDSQDQEWFSPDSKHELKEEQLKVPRNSPTGPSNTPRLNLERLQQRLAKHENMSSKSDINEETRDIVQDLDLEQPNALSVQGGERVVKEFPWLFYLPCIALSTMLASAIECPPILFVLLFAAFNFFSFQYNKL